jgi:hypothetical protein
VDAATTQLKTQLGSVPPTQAVVSSEDDGLAVSLSGRRDQDAVAVALPVKIAASGVPVKAAVPGRDDNVMEVDYHSAIKSAGIPSSSKSSGIVSARAPSTKIDASSSMVSNTHIQADTSVPIHAPLNEIPAATISQQLTHPLASNNRQTVNCEPLSSIRSLPMPADSQQASSSSGSASSDKMYDSFWSSGALWSAGNKDASSSRQETRQNSQNQEKIPTTKRSSGMDMRMLEEALTKEVPLDSTDEATSALLSAPSSVTSAASTNPPTSARTVTSTPGLGPIAGTSSATLTTAPRVIPPVSASNAAVNSAPTSSPASQRPSTPTKATGAIAPVSQLPSKSTPVPVPLLRKDMTPASTSQVSSISRKFSHQPPASSVSAAPSQAPSPSVCMFPLLWAFRV